MIKKNKYVVLAVSACLLMNVSAAGALAAAPTKAVVKPAVKGSWVSVAAKAKVEAEKTDKNDKNDKDKPQNPNQTQNQIDKEAVAAFQELRKEAEAAFTKLLVQYMKAGTAEEKQQLVQQGKSELSEISTKFNQTYNTYSAKGASQSVLDTAQKQFDNGVEQLYSHNK
ncbi:hypothetical protein [Paenibacillus gansuensis]|uniref:Uncharacterized protein n=1 Tax=Paenibacillus gansuensis TaxID=306542 RepID=A0ABW5PA25_9BACL